MNKVYYALFFLIFINACSSRHTPAPVVSLYAATPLTHSLKDTINQAEYTVKQGDTLYSIAWRANTDVRQIITLNEIKSPYYIFPKQKLFLSAKAATSIKQGKIKTSTNKTSSKESNKSSKDSSKKTVTYSKKAVATTKKQAYGENVSTQKTSKKITEKNIYPNEVAQWSWPSKGKVIARFSTAQNGNKGIDITGHRGDKIIASADGKVVYAGQALRGYGKLIIVKHSEDYLSAYAHNDVLLVKEQQSVKAGDVIAKMGSTDAQRVMLHFEIRYRGKSVNPIKYLPKQ
jgi:lipoprotein NlpD